MQTFGAAMLAYQSNNGILGAISLNNNAGNRLTAFCTFGVVVSTIVFGALFYLVAQLLHINIPLIYCFIFGALFSPTDPIAVGAILKKSKISPRLNMISFYPHVIYPSSARVCIILSILNNYLLFKHRFTLI